MSAPKKIVILVRQRIVSKSNGSSRYLISILEYLKSCGHELEIVWPAEATFGRWPFLFLSRDVTQFKSLRWRAGFRVGNFVFSKSPKIYLLALIAVMDRLLLKSGLIKTSITKKAPSSLTAPVFDAERWFVEDVVRTADAVLFDYAFSIRLAGAWVNSKPSLVLMHDLFSKRDSEFTQQGLADYYGGISRGEEMSLLSKAGGIIAIQEDEAREVRRFLPNAKIGIAPVAMEVTGEAQPGNDDLVLFVGSNAEPNLIGIRWFLESVWPLLKERRPNLRLEIAGSCCHEIMTQSGVNLLGVVPDLRPIYARAGVVISPLTVGSGLKVKLIEGLAAGKAMVVTPTTLQGVPALSTLVSVAEDPEHFAKEVSRLLAEAKLRSAMGADALEYMRAHFSPDKAYDWIGRYFSE